MAFLSIVRHYAEIGKYVDVRSVSEYLADKGHIIVASLVDLADPTLSATNPLVLKPAVENESYLDLWAESKLEWLDEQYIWKFLDIDFDIIDLLLEYGLVHSHFESNPTTMNASKRGRLYLKDYNFNVAIDLNSQIK